MTLKEIKNTISALKPVLRTQYSVSEIEIFGSWVRNEQHVNSDLDILVDFDREISLLDLSKLRSFLIEELGMNIDIVSRKSLRKELMHNIISEAVSV